MNIDGFKYKVETLARPSLYTVRITGAPVQGIDSELFEYTCKSAQLPDLMLGTIEVPYMGRKIKYPGDRTYSEWTTTIIGDADMTIYKQLFEWHSKINHPSLNTAVTRNANNFKCDAYIDVLDSAGNSRMRIKLVGLWPSNVQSVELSFETTDSTLDIPCTWAFDYAVLVD